jgi:ABC-type glucose/galactose transport system permease subunit
MFAVAALLIVAGLALVAAALPLGFRESTRDRGALVVGGMVALGGIAGLLGVTVGVLALTAP